ncbi:branched-chain amino acid ABC transporter permease [Microbacterium sp. A94]|uniref:branched-chain amino acid ABC transporter permease n=1 Tax=Microbacterium sp. A94 TaxID=3450717 RepID=UPI003F427688
MIEFLQQNDLLLKTLMMYIVLGLSVQVVLRAGVFSLASAGFWGISAYTTAILTKLIPWPLAILIGLLICAAASGLLALLLTRLRGLYLGMGTIAFNLLVVAVALNWTPVTGGPSGIFGIPMVMSLPTSIGLAVLAVASVALWQSRSGGRFADALRTDEPLAMSLGIDTFKLRIATFMFSAVLGALSGSMSALSYGVLGPNDSGFSLVVMGLTIVVLGGTSSWVGAVIGAFIVTMLPRWIGFVREWTDVVYGLLIIIMVIFAPQGIWGIIQQLWHRVRQRKLPDAPVAPATTTIRVPTKRDQRS